MSLFARNIIFKRLKISSKHSSNRVGVLSIKRSLYHQLTRPNTIHSTNYLLTRFKSNGKPFYITPRLVTIQKCSMTTPTTNTNTNTENNNQTSLKTTIDSNSTEVLNPIDRRTRDYFYDYRTMTNKNNNSATKGPKRSVFSATDTEMIFVPFTTFQLLETYFLFQLCSSKLLTTLMIKIMNDAMSPASQNSTIKKLMYSPLLWLVRKQYFPLFTGGETLEECKNNANVFLNNGVRLAIDNSTEEALDVDAWNRNAQNKKDLIKSFSAALGSNIETVPLKMTGVLSPALLEYLSVLIKFDSPKDLDPLKAGLMSEEMQSELNDGLERVSDIVSFAQSKNIKVWLDAEQYTRQPGMNYIARLLSNKFNKNGEIWVYNTYQMYLNEGGDWVRFDIDYGRRNGHSVGIKLVRGAYLGYEKALARVQRREDPIQDTKERTDDAYNDMIEYMIREIGDLKNISDYGSNSGNNRTNLGFAVCTHNRESIEVAVGCMNKYKLKNSDYGRKYVAFAQLKGMADNLTFGLGISGYNALKWIPYGDFNDVWPYLMRRLEENQDMLSGMAREKRLYWIEIKRRLFSR